MNDLSQEVGLLKRQVRDVQSVAGNVQHMLRKLVDGRVGIDRPGGLAVRAAMVSALAHIQGRSAEAVAREHFATDRDLDRLLTLRAVTNPAATGTATWAAELTDTVTADVADRLIPQTAFSRLRAQGIAYAVSSNGALIKVPTWSPTASGAFVAEGSPIPVSQFTFGSFSLKGKKCAGIVALTNEMLLGSPFDVEVTLRAILSESLGLLVDNILLDANPATTSRPAGLLNGLTPLTPTAAGGSNALLGDIKQLTAAIAPALKPVLITGPVQAATLGVLVPNSTATVLVVPTVAAGTVIAVDAAAFASALGVPAFRASQNVTIHEDTAPTALSATGSPNTVAAPIRSAFQTDVTALRTIIPIDWLLRRSGAVAVVNGATW